ncbi:MAG TPA: hypothetical protein VFE16_02425 [Candidatus Cybelea sp.]|jgi:hypothetical protein|nr:hypothetical protein [Candidatus Cybelea sp.]
MAIFIPPQRSTAQADIKKLLEFIVVHRGIVSTKQRELAYTLPGWRVDGFLHIPEDEEDRAVRLRDKLDSVAMSSTAQ